MTTKKAPKDKPKQSPSIQINRSRGGGKKKPDLFARLRNDEHPLDRIIPIDIEFNPEHSDVQPVTSLDVQPNIQPDVQEIELPDVQLPLSLDVQNIVSPDVLPSNQLDAQNIDDWTPSNKSTGRPDSKSLDTQTLKTETSSNETTGRPNLQSLDAKTSRPASRTSSKENKLDAKTSKKNSPDVQTDKDPDYWRKWEAARATDRVTLRPNAEILKKFKVFCAQNDLGLTEFFELSGLKFIELDVQQSERPDVLTSIDDRRLKMMFKSKPFIINLYLAYNAIFNELAVGGAGKKWTAKWSPRDDETAHRYNELPPAILELGILQTQIQKGIGTSRIQTFKYYTDEIEKVLESGVSDELLDGILKYHRTLWKKQTGREVDLSFLEDK